MRAFVILALLLVPGPLSAQDAPPADPLELSEAVLKLEMQLSSQSIPERDAAEQRLVAWGLPVLDHLSPVTGTQPGDLQQRLQRVRMALERLAVISVTNPSKLEFTSPLTLGQTLAEIRKQTGNVVSAAVSEERLQQKLEWDQQPLAFWSVLEQILVECDLAIDPFASQPQELTLVERSQTGPQSQLPRAVASVLAIEVTRVDATRNFLKPELNRMSYGIVVRWEPRLRPISIDIAQASIKVVDEYDQSWQAPQSEQIFYGLVQPEIPELEFSLEQELVNRQVEELKSLSGTATAILPGRIESFEFPGIGNVPPDTQLTKGGATVTYDGLLKLDDLFGVRVALSFSEENNALESHQGWAYRNECYLQTAAGQRIEAIGTETYQQENSRLGVMYLFPEVPADAKLVYRTPAAIVKVEIPFQLKGIKLP